MIFHLVQRDNKLMGLGDVHQKLIQMGMPPNIYSTPSNMTIITCHDFSEKSYVEKHMDYVGLDYVVLQPDDISSRWRFTHKIKCFYDYIKSGRCETEYLLFLDAPDTVFLRHPDVVLDAFISYDCDMLFNAVGGITKGHFRLMPDKLEPSVSTTNNTELFLNSGVWMARTNNILDILESAYSYVDDSVWNGEWSDFVNLQNGWIDISHKDTWFPEFPKGITCDQSIFRWIYPDFYPRMKIDTEYEFAIRDSEKFLGWFIDYFS